MDTDIEIIDNLATQFDLHSQYTSGIDTITITKNDCELKYKIIPNADSAGRYGLKLIKSSGSSCSSSATQPAEDKDNEIARLKNRINELENKLKKLEYEHKLFARNALFMF